MAVEGALVFSAVLAPLLLGVLQYGAYFWQAQHTSLLDPNVDQSSIVGTYCTSQIPDLLTRVRQAALVAAQNVEDDTDTANLSLSDVAASVVSYTPDALGLLVEVTFTVAVSDEVLSFFPLPDDGNLVTKSQVNLVNVKISSGSC